MFCLPKAAEPLVSAFSVAFTRPTFQRVAVLMVGAILSVRQRTVTAMLRAVGPLAKGHWSDFHRVLCCRVWSTWPLGKVLAAMVLELVPADQPVVCPVDDTNPQHKGKHVYGKGRHHDACRSTHSHVVWVWGHKWVTLVSRFHPDANLYEAPKPRRSPKGGRPRTKGRRLAKPREAIKKLKCKRFTVNCYGGETRRVEPTWGEGHWYRGGRGLVPVRRVFVHDLEGTHRDEYLYSTDPTLPPQNVVGFFTGRWSVQITFQEVRAYLGFAMPRNWSQKSVLRTAPCLLGLFSVVSLIFADHARGKTIKPLCGPWYMKTELAFSDAMATVRRLCWSEVLRQSPKHRGVIKLPRRLRLTLLDHLSRVA